MTQEGAINYLKNYRMVYADLAPERFLEALDCILSRPSLPSNLDDAAIIYINTPRIKSDKDKVFDEISRNHEYLAFKAGAEWMAGQGKTKEAVIGMATEEIFINVSKQTLDDLDLRPGDKVVVQIIKKQHIESL